MTTIVEWEVEGCSHEPDPENVPRGFPYRTSAILGRVGVSQKWILDLRGGGPSYLDVRRL